MFHFAPFKLNFNFQAMMRLDTGLDWHLLKGKLKTLGTAVWRSVLRARGFPFAVKSWGTKSDSTKLHLGLASMSAISWLWPISEGGGGPLETGKMELWVFRACWSHNEARSTLSYWQKTSQISVLYEIFGKRKVTFLFVYIWRKVVTRYGFFGDRLVMKTGIFGDD